ncbi:hypothetical protein [Microbacterium aquimaris]|uniref:Uncharacterized protein n=1 Tax=Microbacterium aquimaris TaxID=459816 RepID=A0ABU5N4H1_9MICO|nr:hypothetical protein [Microbacterium aquimaris]MDZ8160812.1 hypothetical protein [Microbacterium aquimaris]
MFDITPVERAVICGRDPQRTREAATKLGWSESSADWREVVARDDIDIVDICTEQRTNRDQRFTRQFGLRLRVDERAPLP